MRICILHMAAAFILMLLGLSSFAWSGAGQEYTVSFQGLKDSDLLSMVKKSSSAVQRRDSPPASLGLLRRRAQNDVQVMTEVLQAQSHFAAQIQVEITPGSGEEPARVTFNIDPGPEYTIHKVRIRSAPPHPSPRPQLPSGAQIGLTAGTKAEADTIRQAKSQLQSKLSAQGYLFVQVDKPAVYVDERQAQVDVVFTVHPGPRAVFGSTRIQGAKDVAPEYIRDKISWQPGQVYDPQAVNDMKKQLIQTGLFSLVQVAHPESLNDQGRLPMTVIVHETKPKQVSFSLGYETDIGLKGTAAWEHTNLMGRGENLGLQLELSRINQEFQTTFRKDEVFDRDLDLFLQGSTFREDTEAYTSTGAEISGHLEHQYSRHLRLGAGLGYKGSRIEDVSGKATYHQISFPAFADWDTRDSALNPTRGTLVGLHLTPILGLFTEDFSLFKTSLSTRWYRDLLSESGRAVLALRGRVGSILASSTEEVPPDERWYAGGGGSIRGYPYQELGPRTDDEPSGGRSLLEASAELRWKWTEKIGSVFFLDAGNAYESVAPDPTGSLFWSAGLGGRYYTAIGPLRVDIAFPLNKEEYIDDSFQVYISVGQAF